MRTKTDFQKPVPARERCIVKIGELDLMAKTMVVGKVAQVEIMPADDEGSLGAQCVEHAGRWISDACTWTLAPQYSTDDLLEIAGRHADGDDR